MKKVLAILLPILAIGGAAYLLYVFVLLPIVDPPADAIMEDAIEAAEQLVEEPNSEAYTENFRAFFSERSIRGLEREWSTLALGGTRRGSWYRLALGMLNEDETRPTVVGLLEDEEAEGEEGEEEEDEEEDDEETEQTVIINQNDIERYIPMIREGGTWRIDIEFHPEVRSGV